MCQSSEQGGRRCATHTRPRFAAATPGTATWDEAAAEYGATREGESVLAEMVDTARREGRIEDEVAAQTALTRGQDLRGRAFAVRQALVRPKVCRRCGGRGYVSSRQVYAGAPGGCFACGGTGEVESDRSTIASKKRATELRKALGAWVTDEGERRGLDRPKACDVGYAVSHLEENEPDRLPGLLASFEAGRPDLYESLMRYAAERGYMRFGGRRLSPDEAVALLD